MHITVHHVFCCRRIPYFGPSLQAPFKEYLSAQKAKLHDKEGIGQAGVSSEYCLLLLFLILSIRFK